MAERDALVVAALEGKLGLTLPVRVVEHVDPVHLARPGQGNALALVLTSLPGNRLGAVVVDAEPPQFGAACVAGYFRLKQRARL